MKSQNDIRTTNEDYPESNVRGANMGAHLGAVGPRWAPCWPHDRCYQGRLTSLLMRPWH